MSAKQSNRKQRTTAARRSQPRRAATQPRNPEIRFDDLGPLWQRWLGANQDKPVPLDRWLKQAHNRQQGLSPAQRWALNSAMIQASRFQQLAQALEDQFFQDDEIDWQQWDLQWQAGQLRGDAFWYWIGLRGHGQWLKSRHQLRDTSYRERLFAALKQQALEQPLSPLWCLWHGIRPQWLALLQQRAQQSGWSDKQLQSFIKKQCDFPPLWLRAKAGTNLAELEQSLNQQGVDAQLKHINGSEVLAAFGGKAVQSSSQYQQGEIEIQDLASQQIAAAVGARPGDKIWDACAGAGGKSLALASALNGKGSVTATDIQQYKLDELKRRAKRAQLQNIRQFCWDGEQPLKLPAEIRKQHGFDRILVDAPCTAAGTWRRNPDARWRFSASDSQQLQTLQQQLLQHASAALRPGGVLVYATCSWQLSENEQQIDTFLQHNPDFTLDEQCMLGAPLEDADCMFYARLLKR